MLVGYNPPAAGARVELGLASSRRVVLGLAPSPRICVMLPPVPTPRSSFPTRMREVPARTDGVHPKPVKPSMIVSGPLGMLNDSPPGMIPLKVGVLQGHWGQLSPHLTTAIEATRGRPRREKGALVSGWGTDPIVVIEFHDIRSGTHCMTVFEGSRMVYHGGCKSVVVSKQPLSPESTVNAVLAPTVQKPLPSPTCARIHKPPGAMIVVRNWARHTTTTNCESLGYGNRKLSEDESLNGKSRTLRASMPFGSVVGPKGIMAARYGGVPEPEILRERSLHCRGALVKVNENAAAPVASSAIGSAVAMRPRGVSAWQALRVSGRGARTVD